MMQLLRQQYYSGNYRSNNNSFYCIRLCRQNASYHSTVLLTLLQQRPAIPMENSKIEVSELRNPWTYCHKIWHGWLCRRYDPASQNSNRSPQWGRPGKWAKYYSSAVFNFFFLCDYNICSRPMTKPENWFLRSLIHRMSIPGYWFSRGINYKNFQFPHFLPKPKMGVNWHFQA